MRSGQGAARGVVQDVFAQLRESMPWIVGTLGVVVLLGVVIMAVHFGSHVDVNLIISDPADIGLLPGYTGLYTYIGAFALLTAGAVCIFAAQLLKGRSDAFPSATFLVTFGVLVAWLGIDDLLMFHEWAGLAIAEILDRADIPGERSRLEAVVFAAYAIGWLAWIVSSWRTVRRTAYSLLLLVLVFFGLSLTIDLGLFFFPGILPDTEWMPTTISVAEEMLKLTGVFFAFAYAWHTAIGAVRREMTCQSP